MCGPKPRGWTGGTYLGIIPPAMMPSATSSRVCRMSISWNLVETSSLSRRTPGTSVIRMSFSALRAAAICKAAHIQQLSVLHQVSQQGWVELRAQWTSMPSDGTPEVHHGPFPSLANAWGGMLSNICCCKNRSPACQGRALA